MANNDKDIVNVLFEWMVDGLIWLAEVSMKALIIGIKLLWLGLVKLSQWVIRLISKKDAGQASPVEAEEILD